MKRTGFSTLIAMLLLAFSGFAQQSITLRQCIDTAIANHITVKLTALQIERDAADLKQSKFNRVPEINAGFNIGGSRGRSIDPFTNSFVDQAFNNSNSQLNASLPLFSGGQIANTILQNKETLNASTMDWQQAKDNLTINVIGAYLAVLNNEDQLDISQSQEMTSGMQVERLKIVAKEGATAPYTLSDLKGEQASNRVAVINAQNALEQSKITLCRFMNIPYNKNLTLSRDVTAIAVNTYGYSSSQVYEEALKNMAMVKATDYRENAAEKAVTIAKGALWPSVSLSGGIGTNYSSAAEKYTLLKEYFGPTDNFVLTNGIQNPVYSKQQDLRKDAFGFGTQYSNNLNAQFGLYVQIPILSRYTVRNRITQAKINLRNAEAVSANIKTQLQQDVEQAHQNMFAAFKRYYILQQQVDALKESFEAAENRFNAGVINSAEYIVIKNNYDRSVVNFSQAGYEYALRTRVLDYYRGKQL